MLINNGEVIVEVHDLVEKFNDNYVKKIEKSSGEKSRSYISDTDLMDDDVVINQVLQQYSSHPSMIKTRQKLLIPKIQENFNSTV